jgi:hypothetical protein
VSNPKLDSDDFIVKKLTELGFTDYTAAEGRLMLVELAVKANGGYKNSHTEEAFLCCFGILTKKRKLNALGGRFLMNMLYASSNKQSKFAIASLNYRWAEYMAVQSELTRCN